MVLSLINLNNASPERVAKCAFFDEGNEANVDDDTDGENDPVPTQAHSCGKKYYIKVVILFRILPVSSV